MKSWVEFWNAENPIYVNERHKLLHYRMIAQDIRDLVPGLEAVVLDYGCGEALSADLVTDRCLELFLCDAAPNVRDKLKTRFGDNEAIDILSPEEVDALQIKLDLIVIHSVAQYVPRAEFAQLLDKLGDKLRPGGTLIVGDVLPTGLSPVTDAKALLGFGFEGGFLIPAALGLVRTALSDYRKIRGELGLTHYEESEMLSLLEGLGFTARRLDKNLGHNQARMAFAAVKFTPLPEG
ncbi:MAG: class I SAM-dependent methyltransferase [Proteobacteria bacterium]|nr:class I SAM-dependent methyltransferase [Pseudomonadota bacterium]